MSNDPKFFCVRVARGDSICGEQCPQCLKRDPLAEANLKPVNGKKLEDNVVPMKQPPAEPGIVGQITITMYEDGRLNINAPFHDRFLFHGMMSLAMDLERDIAVQAKVKRAMPEQTNSYLRRKIDALKSKFGKFGAKVVDEALNKS